MMVPGPMHLQNDLGQNDLTYKDRDNGTGSAQESQDLGDMAVRLS